MSHVSVIIPNYNGQRWLAHTIDSCLLQIEYIKDIVVVDDFSTDESWDTLIKYQQRFPDLIKLIRNKEKGGNNARNLGFQVSTGEFIQWLDADDQIMQGKLASQVAYLEQNQDISIAMSDWELHTYVDDKLVRKEVKINSHQDDMVRELLKDNWSPPNAYLLRRPIAEMLAAMNAWNPQTKVGQDREYFSVAAITGAKFGYVPGLFAIYNRWNKSSVSAANQKVRFENLAHILDRVQRLLEEQGWPTIEKRACYNKIVITQKVMIGGMGYPVTFEKHRPRFTDIDWQMIRGFRTRIKMLILLFKLSLFRG